MTPSLHPLPRVVLDTSVVVAAHRSSGGASAAVLQLAFSRTIQPVATAALALEYESVLMRQQHASASRDSNASALLAILLSRIEPVRVYFRFRPQLPDVADEHVLEAAINGSALYLITHNTRDFPAAPDFGITVATPRAIMTMQRTNTWRISHWM